MTADYRDLITRMAKELDDYRQLLLDDRTVTHRLSDEARAALADGPAVPEVVGSEWQPCVKLPITVHVREQRPGEQHVSTREGITPVQPDDLIMLGVDGEEYPIGRELFQRTYRMGSADEPAVPESREPVTPPADGEVAELVEMLKGIAYWRLHGTDKPTPFDIRQAARLSRAAELLERLSPPQPVPASERLPGPEDCAPWPQPSDKSGWCWMSRAIHGFYGSFAIWEQVSVVPMCWEVYTHWLPAHSLPVPEVGED